MDPRPVDPIAGAPAGDATEVVEAPPAIPPVPDEAMTSLPESATGAAPGRSRGRWLIGGGIAVAAIAGIALVVSLLGARPLPEALKYVPADSAVVVELRPELPGDQRQKLGNFLAHFPGFADQSILQTKIDEALGRIVNESTGGAVDYTSQVKPLLAGPMIVAVSAEGLSGATDGSHPSDVLLVATTEAGTTCDTVFKASTAGSTHRDVEIRTVDDSLSLSCATHGRFLLIGDKAGIEGGIDARLDNRGIDADATYRTAHGSLAGDQLATAYVNGGAISELLSEMTSVVGTTVPADVLPAWTIGGVRVDDDALVFDALTAPQPGPSLPAGAPSTAPAAASRFAASLPADTLGFVEIHGVGALAGQALGGVRADPDQAGIFEQLEGALALLGGADNLVNWIEDVGIAILPTDDAVGGALLIRGTDAEAAASRVTQIRNLLVLASTGTDITVNDTDHKGVRITSVDLGDLNELLGGLGGLGVPDLPDVALGDARISFQLAARDDLVIIAFGDGIAERILDVEAGSSLKMAPTYARSIELAGATNSAEVYVAIDATLTLVERLLPAEAVGSFMSEVKPYTDHLAGASFSSTITGSSNRFRWVLSVK